MFDDDKKYEEATRPLFIKELISVYPGSTCNIHNTASQEDKTIDRKLGIDMILNIPGQPNLSVQLKSRRRTAYDFFPRNNDILLTISKNFRSGTYPGDYTKCQADALMYGFGNHDDHEKVNALDYWILFDFSMIKSKFRAAGGYEKIPQIMVRSKAEKDRIVNYMIIPIYLIKDCIILTKKIAKKEPVIVKPAKPIVYKQSMFTLI